MLVDEKLLEQMLQSGNETLPDDESYDLVIRMLFSTDQMDAAFKYIDLTMKYGNVLSMNLFMNCVRSCVKQGRLDILVAIIEKCRATDQNKALCLSWNLCIFIAEVAIREDNSKLAYYGLEFMAGWIVKGERARPPKVKVSFHIRTIPRPQDEFTIIVNNAKVAFENVWLQRSDDGHRFFHPSEKLSVLDFVDKDPWNIVPLEQMEHMQKPETSTDGGPTLLRYKDQLKEAFFLAFDSPSWKVNGVADHLLRSLLGSQIHYYPIDLYKCVLSHPDVVALEGWISTKDLSTDERLIPKWHILCDEEIHLQTSF